MNISVTASKRSIITLRGFKRTSGHILKQALIRMSPLELRLPHMVMRINESRRHDLAGAVDYLRLIRGRFYMSRNVNNLVSFDKK